MVVLSREEFDAIEFDAALTGEHRTAAERMTWLAEHGAQTGAMPRAEAYARVGEQWMLADEPEAAASWFLRALEDGGSAAVDAQVPLARALFMLGRNDEAEDLIRQIGREPAEDPRVCDLMAELLVERGDLAGALDWATAGVQLCLGGEPRPVGDSGPQAVPAAVPVVPPTPAQMSGDDGGDNGRQRSDGGLNELKLLLSLRFRIRNDLGLPDDDYDRLLDELPPDPTGPASR